MRPWFTSGQPMVTTLRRSPAGCRALAYGAPKLALFTFSRTGARFGAKEAHLAQNMRGMVGDTAGR